jgi:hypothetical protein
VSSQLAAFIAVVLIITSIYVLSSSLTPFVEAIKKKVIEISCSPQDNGKTRCCGSEVDDFHVYGYTGVVYCTTCDDTNPPSHCTPREKIEKTSVNPGSDVLNALKGSKGLDINSPSLTTDTTKIPKNLTSKGSELSKDGVNLEDSNNPPPTDSNDTLR